MGLSLECVCLSVCLLYNWNLRSNFYLFPTTAEHFQTQISSSFLKLGTQKEVRPWTQNKLQHPPSRSHYLQILHCYFFSFPCSCHSGSLLFFRGKSLQALSLFPPPLSHTGSLLLAVHFYSLPRAAPVIPSTALGILLLILSSLLAYAGKTRRVASFKASPSYSFTSIWSALPTGLYELCQSC